MNTIQFLNAVVNWLLADPVHASVAASAIAAVTPTPSPNSPWGKLYKVLDVLALNVLHAKDTGVPPATKAQIEETVAQVLAAKSANSGEAK